MMAATRGRLMELLAGERLATRFLPTRPSWSASCPGMPGSWSASRDCRHRRHWPSAGVRPRRAPSEEAGLLGALLHIAEAAKTAISPRWATGSPNCHASAQKAINRAQTQAPAMGQQHCRRKTGPKASVVTSTTGRQQSDRPSHWESGSIDHFPAPHGPRPQFQQSSVKPPRPTAAAPG